MTAFRVETQDAYGEWHAIFDAIFATREDAETFAAELDGGPARVVETDETAPPFPAP